MTLNFNDAGPQQNFEVIPEGTVATLRLTVRPGGAGPDGQLRRSKDGNSEALDCELVVIDGPHANRKLWSLLTVAGTTQGHAKAGEISRRAILKSARGIRPDDKSPAAEKARQIKSYADLDGLNFIGKIGVEPAQNGFKAKNTLDEVITPDRKSWSKPPEPVVKSTASTAQGALSLPAAAAFAKPEWAK